MKWFNIIFIFLGVAVLLLLYSCSTAKEVVCGNDLVELGEECDGTDFGKNDCSSVNNNYSGGELKCSDSCTFDTSGCAVGVVGVTCGNGVINANEQCDDSNRQNGDGCSRNCIVEGSYSCVGVPSVCTSQGVFFTEPPVCGNGARESAEECDDGDNYDGDGCSSECEIETEENLCGTDDEVCEYGTGSVCTTSNGYRGVRNCRSDCSGYRDCNTNAYCGDNIVNGPEECDSGNDNSNSEPNACREDCTVSECGDGVVDNERGEFCDDGDNNNGDGCSASCSIQSGYSCTGSPSVCSLVPGLSVSYTVNGVSGDSSADPGNTVVVTWTATGAPSSSTMEARLVRNDGFITGWETVSLPTFSTTYNIPADDAGCRAGFTGGAASMTLHFEGRLKNSAGGIIASGRSNDITVWCT